MNARGVYSIFRLLRGAFIGGRCLIKGGVYLTFVFLLSSSEKYMSDIVERNMVLFL